ncbi:Tim44/TimA family putative adaptor protein [Oceaniglobus ichthyenteri]|uniref:Tim44/TimA family putative adaptor protein n=1 Tax=Oceaniglobus ichthyenteri TaxID=2136177 RepID=UPI000D389929|nr:Tim44/TimA family putative adaptor protein [Oceaniglobus ichthyenteri]
MSSAVIQLLVLAAIAVFLILRLRSVLGTRDGFEKPPIAGPSPDAKRNRPEFEVIEGGPDRDITDHVTDGSPSAKALADMKKVEPGFNVTEFMQGARGAYEMILMAFEHGDIKDVRDFMSPEVAEAFDDVIRQRHEQGLTVESTFVGLRDIALNEAEFDRDSKFGEITLRLTAELIYVVRDKGGDIIEGSATEIKRQRDVWTFGRTMGANDPNWQLVATGE